MSKNIMTDQALNQINIVGKLLDVVFRSGTLSDGRNYESATVTVRVTQTYGGREEISEIPVSLFAAKYTAANKLNPGYEQIQNLHNVKTAQNVGIDEAATVRINRASIRENNFVSRSGQLINGWQINTMYINEGGGVADVATFNLDIYIMDMHPEEDRNGDPTGRLIVKGGLVQYNGILDVLEFVVENAETAEYIERNWNVDDTVNVRGRIRVTVNEVAEDKGNSFGEDIPQVTTRTVRELVITTGSPEAKEEEFAYATSDIRKAFNVRKAKIEQMQLDAQNHASAKPAAKPAASKYDWE